MENTAGLTVCMIVRDERDNLEQMLPAVLGHADDVVVVDTGSTDGTPGLVRRSGARLFERPWDDDFSAARNRGLEEVRTSHVLWLDADDRIESADFARVRAAVLEQPNRALFLLLVNANADPSAVSSCWQLRVFPARPEHRFEGRIHEQIQASLTRTGTPCERLDATVTHTGYMSSREVLRKSRRNFEMLRRELNEGRDDINVLYHYVKAASRCGELDEAVRVARRCVEDAPPGTPDEIAHAAALQWSRLELQRGDQEAARTVIDRAIERHPEDPLAHFFLGDLLRRQGDLHGALRELETARVSPIRFQLLPVPVAGLRAAIRMQLGEVKELLGDARGAAAVYREAHSENPGNQTVTRALARALVASDAGAEARAVLRTLPETSSHRSEVQMLKASIAFNERDDAEAERLFREVEEEFPRLWAAPLHRGHLEMRQGNVEAALAHYERALSLADNPETRVGIAAAQLEAGKLAESLDHLAEVVDQCATRPLPAGTEALAGEALLRFGRPAEAQGAFERHLHRNGPDARILSRLADCYREMGAGEAARLGYREALRLAPGLEEARRGLESLQTVP